MFCLAKKSNGKNTFSENKKSKENSVSAFSALYTATSLGGEPPLIMIMIMVFIYRIFYMHIQMRFTFK